MNLYNAMDECLSLEKYYVHCENGGDFFIKRENGTLKIFFEWSDGLEDWRNNFKFLVIPWKPYKSMKKPWLCHRGFLKVWKSIKPYIEERLYSSDITKIEIVGYSHGAALALLCYEYCVFNRPNIEIKGVGFGCPRVFWGIVPKSVKERFGNFKVIRNGNDIVTHVPPVLLGFRHVSEVIKIGEGKSEGLIDDHREDNYLANLK